MKSSVIKLKDEISEIFPELTLAKNPVVLNIGQQNSIYLKNIIEQYSLFSAEAIHMLLDASLKSYKWPILYKEIEENIEEEKGKFTDGIPHLEIMRIGYLKDLNIDTSIIEPNQATSYFLTDMRKVFKNNDLAYVAGALVAFEGIAIEEFHILDEIVKGYCKKNSITLDNSSITMIYINSHKKFEIDHEAHLIEATLPYVNLTNIKEFKKGYRNVCKIMSDWWSRLNIHYKSLET
jgi:hypothetical protein